MTAGFRASGRIMDYKIVPGFSTYRVNKAGQVLGKRGFLTPQTVCNKSRVILHSKGSWRSFTLPELVAYTFPDSHNNLVPNI